MPATDEKSGLEGIDKAKRANRHALIADVVFLAIYSGAALAATAVGAGHVWLFCTTLLAAGKGADIVSDAVKLKSLDKAAQKMKEDPSGSSLRNRLSQFRDIAKNCRIVGVTAWMAAAVMAFVPFFAIAAPLAAPVFWMGGGILLAGGFAEDVQKGGEKALNAIQPPAPAAACAPVAALSGRANVGSRTTGRDFEAANARGEKTAPARERISRPGSILGL